VVTSFVRIDLGTSLWFIRITMFIRGFLMGFSFVPMQAASYATIPPASNGRASSIFSTQRQVGVSLGVAVVASILVQHMSLIAPPSTALEVARSLTGFHWAFGAAVLLTFAAAIAALFVRDREAAGTMNPASLVATAELSRESLELA
jgi:MFS family permease